MSAMIHGRIPWSGHVAPDGSVELRDKFDRVVATLSGPVAKLNGVFILNSVNRTLAVRTGHGNSALKP